MDINSIKKLVDIKLQKNHLELSKIVAREEKIKSEVKKLRALSFDVQSFSAANPEMQSIGADVIWMRWANEMIKRLNIELSQILAQKENYQKMYQRVFAQQCAVDHLFRIAQKNETQQNNLRRLSASVDTVIYAHLTKAGAGFKNKK